MIYHIVLMKLKASATKDQVDAFEAAGKAMVGQIPGLKDFKFGPVHVPTAQRAKGYQIGVVATLEKPEDLPGYAAHASHQVTTGLRLEIAEDTLAFDMDTPD